ncbi:hypothetical protein N7474_006195 [Penicillium riverlandense]|uniref:uncharacterized protein n=1 Tax=Penicillium riverlandense TaxID=1903569 RepID=UPI0025469B82|nr:uncharacterized protein N7474_006195 [Penicillium riverlandense]KAJ5820604.1 hypothetical protein N7474_006195 [Penicillium riverlandense]
MSPRRSILLARPREQKTPQVEDTPYEGPRQYVEQGGILETDDDVPESLREQPYAEENQRHEKRKKTPDNSAVGSMCPPININVLPAAQQSISTPDNGATPAKPGCADSIMVHGLLDVAVEEYTEWQQSRVSNEAFRDHINKARDVTLENCLDLMQIYEDRDQGFFVNHGVKVGAAQRFVSDIGLWVKRHAEVNCNENNSNSV